MKTLISIIVPCYGVEKYLNRGVSSIVNQTIKDIEIILVDDGSPDNVPTMCDSWAKKDSRIKVIHQANDGLGNARNTGLSHATGEFVAFLDPDDYVDVNTYQYAYETAVRYNADVVFWGGKNEIKDGIWQDHILKREIFEQDALKHYVLDMIANDKNKKNERKWRLCVWHGLYKRSIIEDNDIKFASEREVVSEDIPFKIMFLNNAKRIVNVDRQFYYYCKNGASLTVTFKKEKYKRYKKLHSLMIDMLGRDPDAILRCDRCFIGQVRQYLFNLEKSDLCDKISIYKEVVSDPYWDSISSRYKPSWLPLYSRLFLSLMNLKSPQLLQLFYFLTTKIK